MTDVAVQRADITTVSCHAIVNAANSRLAGGAGVDGAIHTAGGPEIMAECRRMSGERGGCPPGGAVVTTAGQLPAAWVIHAVGPIWDQANADAHDTTLASAYTESLERAREIGARSVAFPNISTGVYGFPKERAASVATTAVADWLASHARDIDTVLYVCFDDENLGIYADLGIEQR